MPTIDRRTILTTLAVGLVTPIGAPAQPATKVPRIGYLAGASEPAQRASRAAFLRGLAEHGWVDGRNVVLEYRYANGVVDALPTLAVELVRAPVDVIVSAPGTASALAAKRATDRIPIVFTTGGDPVEVGIVPNLARPGGNVTGVAGDVTALEKRLETLREVTPKASRYGVLMNPDNRAHPPLIRTLEGAAARLRVTLRPIPLRDPSGFERAWAAIKREGLGGVVMLGDAMFQTHGKQLVALAAEAKLPMVSSSRQLVQDGGLMSFAVDVLDLQRQAAELVDRILRGASPGEIPVAEPRKFEMVVNLKAADAIGLTIPQSVLLMADEVIR